MPTSASSPDAGFGEPLVAPNDDPATRRVYRVSEYETVDVPLSELMQAGRLHLHPEVTAKGYFAVRLQGDRLRLQAGGFVGLIPLNAQVAIDVAPRVPISNLSRMLRFSGHVPVALRAMDRTYDTDGEPFDSLLDIYAAALIQAADAIQTSGLYRVYDRRRADTSFPRGRILLTPTVSRWAARGIAHKATTAWYERTVDNGPNRCVKYAIWFLASRYMRMRNARKGSRQLQRELNRVFRIFDGVRLDAGRGFMSDPIVSGAMPLPPLRGYYSDTLAISLAIIREHAIALDHVGSDLRLSSLVLNMNVVFEAYLRSVLRTEAAKVGWNGRVLDGNKHEGAKLLFDASSTTVVANPDIVVAVGERRRRRVPLLIDAKYKPLVADPEREDLNQVISYGLSYRAENVVLVHPRGRASMQAGLRLLGTVRPVTVHVYTFDLGAVDLAAEERRFAQAMQGVYEREEPALASEQQSLHLTWDDEARDSETLG